MKTTNKPQPQLEDSYKLNPMKACRVALRLTRNLPENDRLEAIDKLLGTHGTEAIRGEWQNGYWCDIVAAYCNTGDTYAVTVIQVRVLIQPVAIHRVHYGRLRGTQRAQAWDCMTPDPSITHLTLNGTLYAVSTNQLIALLLTGRKLNKP